MEIRRWPAGGDDSEPVARETARQGADGLYGVMLMSSTHHRFAGLFTIRRPGARPVTQLLVRGSPALWGQKVHLCATARCFLHIPMALGGLQARAQQPDVWYKCSIRGKGEASTLATLLLARPACRLGRGDDGPLAHVLDQLHGASPLNPHSVYACAHVLKMPSDTTHAGAFRGTHHDEEYGGPPAFVVLRS